MKTLMSTLDFTLDYIEAKRLCSLKAYVDVSIKTANGSSKGVGNGFLQGRYQPMKLQ